MSKVLLHSLVFFPDNVSTAYILTDLALELRKLGHQITVLTTTPHYNIGTSTIGSYRMKKRWGGLIYYNEYEGIPVWHITLSKKDKRVWKRGIDFIWFHVMSLVVGIILINRQEVVIATSPPLTIGLISWLLAYCWKAPAVYKVAEVYPDLAIRQGAVRHPSLIKFFRWIEELVYAGNTKIVTIAEQFKRLLHERGVPDNKLIMIRDSVDIDLYHPSNRDNAFSREHRLVNSFVVLYAGNIGLFQDWESVLCSAELVSRYPITIVIIGDGVRREWLIDQVRHRGLDNVKWIGYQAAERMSEINASCDIAIIPMTRAGALDGLPSKIYTIMACGKPVIATADVASDMAWLIQEAKCGRVVPPDDPRALAEAIEAAYLDPASLSSEGENGRQFVKEFSKESIAQKYSNLILSLVGGR